MATRYIPELDGLRAIAAIAVVAFHPKVPGMSGGFLGVDVFFVLSGFLTASIALSGKYNFSDFMIRRLRRLWPLLICVSVVVTICAALFGNITAGEALPGAFFLGNFATAFFETRGPLGHTWTLGNEMQFYALVAILAITLPRTAFRLACIVLFLGVTFTRVRYAYLDEWRLGYFSPIAHSSGLFAGALIATLPLERMRAPTILFVLSAAAVLTAFVLAEYKTAEALLLWIAVAELGTIGLIVAIVKGTGAVSFILRVPTIRSLGVLSFGIYLWHYPIAVIARDIFLPAFAFMVTLSVSVILAMLSYHFIEQPFRTKRTPIQPAVAE